LNDIFISGRVSNDRNLREKPRKTDRFSNSLCESPKTSNQSNSKSKSKKNGNVSLNFDLTQRQRNNAFAGGKNGQNFSKKNNANKSKKNDESQNNNGEILNENRENEEAIAILSSTNESGDEDESESDEVEEQNVNKKKVNGIKRRSRKKTGACWKYFRGGVKGTNPKNKKPCILNVCTFKIIDENNLEKECKRGFVACNSTSHMNDHLYFDHKLQEFKPSYLKDVGALNKSVNDLIAKFIVSSAAPFRICDNKYFKVC
jgi:hypothetical protein